MLDALNPPQREAATHSTGPLLILAGAGSGKTRVLVARMAWLLQQGVSPYRIIAITFTNKAAAEMKERVQQVIGPRARDIWVSTFHSACVRILRRDIEKLGYSREFAILDTGDQQAVVKDILKTLNLSDKQYSANAMLGAISDWKNELKDEHTAAREARDFLVQKQAEVYALYQQRLRAAGALDFDDLIRLTVRLLQEWPQVREYYQNKFEQVLVDEYQDTNQAQYILVSLLAGKHGNLCVVGDDDQGIYSWRGATIRNILDFEENYPNAHVVKLEQNYRSTQNILDAANAVVHHNLGRKDKRLFTTEGRGAPIIRYQARDEHDEAWYVADQIKENRQQGTPCGDMAILYRTHAQSRALEEIFVRREIPYAIVGGLKFFERKEVKDVIAYLRLIQNPADTISFKRAIQVPRRGVGPVTLDKVEEAAMALGKPILEVASWAGSMVPGLGKAAVAKVGEFAELIHTLRRQYVEFELPLPELIDQVLTRSGLLAELQAENTIEAQGRIENLREMKSVAMDEGPVNNDPDFDNLPLARFLERVALVADADSLDGGSADRVVMMTLHTAKGLEFPTVFLVGMEEGVFPSSRSEDEERLEEERRLCYVGMTRARCRLYLTHAFSRTLYGQTRNNAPSRFLAEIPEELVEVQGVDFSSKYSAMLGDVPGYGRFRGYEGTPRGGNAGGSGNGNSNSGTWGSRTWGQARPPAEEDFSPAIGSPGWGQAVRSATPAVPAPAAPTPAAPTPAAPTPAAPTPAAPAPAPSAATPAGAQSVYGPGDSVTHVKFGTGTVKEQKGDTVTVIFPGMGEKNLVASYLQRSPDDREGNSP